MGTRATLAIAAALAAGTVIASDRSRAARAEFVRANPCPATGKTAGPCAGHQVDHVLALCAGGTDRASNMAWLTVAQHKSKTSSDVGICRAQKAGVLNR
jgi:hypothetical protein